MILFTTNGVKYFHICLATSQPVIRLTSSLSCTVTNSKGGAKWPRVIVEFIVKTVLDIMVTYNTCEYFRTYANRLQCYLLDHVPVSQRNAAAMPSFRSGRLAPYTRFQTCREHTWAVLVLFHWLSALPSVVQTFIMLLYSVSSVSDVQTAWLLQDWRGINKSTNIWSYSPALLAVLTA